MSSHQPVDPWADHQDDGGWPPALTGGSGPPLPVTAYQQVSPGVTELPRQPYQEAPGVHRIPPPPPPATRPGPPPVPPAQSPDAAGPASWSEHPVPPGLLAPVPQPSAPTSPAAATASPDAPPPPPVGPPALVGPPPPHGGPPPPVGPPPPYGGPPPHVGPPPPHGVSAASHPPGPGSPATPPGWAPESFVPTAEEFAQRRATKPANPVATMGMRAALNRSTLGLVKLPPGQHEQEIRRDIEMVRRNFGGLRQVTVVNPKGGAGKTVAILMLAMTFGQKRGGYVLAWDNNETQGTLGMRAQQDFHSRTVRDMLRDLRQFQGSHGRVGDLSQYVRAQGEGMFDVLASDESATAGEMLTAAAFAEIREIVSRFYKLIFVDTGNNVRAQNWQAAIDATDQLVVTMSARNDSAEPAARMLDHLEQTGRQRLVRQAVTVISMPPNRREIDLLPIQRHFAARTRTVLLAPYERIIDSGEPIRYGQLSSTFRQAWLKIGAAVSEGL
ncbi:chromosome partitioning protein [Solwaraspora sp. WMMD406]|uniref:MinD/ParA family ATP-binding protein n=1 Tax=Solwaraspora sp. WMMD406 TaxID=3016095 RepID=UPI002416125A|nr:chromosome partitioning protein [Solwaraspora sp. WMMD406]MDG4762886.1 chromosome partitioning protein [Solwaraspora sp. WMMD406]